MKGRAAPVTHYIANTDTRYFWNLTRNIYRFTPAIISPNLNVHTVDEVSPFSITIVKNSPLRLCQKMPLAGHLNTTRFFYNLMQNVQGWEAA